MSFSLLIVDDEKDFVATMMKRLRRRGVVCHGVLTGGEAVEWVEHHDLDVVLLDMKLPDMDGNSVLREIKKTRPRTRVFILTGHASVEAGEAGLAEGASDYLLKPVEFEMLFERLFG